MKQTCVICDACGRVEVGQGYSTLWHRLKEKGWKLESAQDGKKHFCPGCTVHATRSKRRVC